jgi:site-specific recombinase XerD
VFLNRDGGRLTEPIVWRLIRRLARTAGIPAADRLSPHSLRHSAITAALNAGVPFRDVQDFAGHADPRTTRRYDRSRHSSTACHLRARQPVGLQRGRQADSRDRGHIPIRTPG